MVRIVPIVSGSENHDHTSTNSHRDLLLNAIHNISPKNTLLSLSKYFISSIVIPSSALRNFQFSSPLREYLGGTHFTGFILDSAQTMRWPAESFIKQDHLRKCRRI